MSRSKPRFQYQQIAQEVKDQILRGEFRVGDRLPSERLLGEQFKVQRNTVRQALAKLESDGHIATRGREGSFVLDPPPARLRGRILVNIGQGSGPNGTALFDGIVRGATAAGFSVGRFSTEPLSDSWMNRVPEQADLPADTAGVILWPHLPMDTERLMRLNEAVPVVLVDHRVTGLAIDCVRFDDVAGGRAVTEHVLARGRRKIAFLTDEVFADSVQARWQGYVLAHESAAVPLDHRLGLFYHFIDSPMLASTLRHLLAYPDTRPTAVVCANDLVAFSLLHLLNVEGLRVPRDVAVTGYGNAMPEYGSAISLTTVDQPFYKMGLEAARVLTERVRENSNDRLRTPLDICLPIELVIRGSA